MPSASFSPELATIMKPPDTAVDRIERSHPLRRKMASRIVRTASEGVTDLHVLMSAAVEDSILWRRERNWDRTLSTYSNPHSRVWLLREFFPANP